VACFRACFIWTELNSCAGLLLVYAKQMVVEGLLRSKAAAATRGRPVQVLCAAAGACQHTRADPLPFVCYRCAAQVLKNEGAKSLFKGAGANILRAVAGAGVLSGYDQLQVIMFGEFTVTRIGGRYPALPGRIAAGTLFGVERGVARAVRTGCCAWPCCIVVGAWEPRTVSGQLLSNISNMGV
jgi:hypothetical protein